MASTVTRPPRRRPAPPPEGEQVVEPYRLTPKSARRAAILGIVLVGVFAALFLRLWALQVLSGTKYVDLASSQSFRALPLQAPRGMILACPAITGIRGTRSLARPRPLPTPHYPVSHSSRQVGQ